MTSGSNPLSMEQMQALRRVRIELILLGMALAKTDDRSLILERFKAEDFQSEIVAQCLQAIKDNKPEVVVGLLSKWNIRIEKRVATTLLDMVRDSGDEERARDVLQGVLIYGGVDLKSALKQALSKLGED